MLAMFNFDRGEDLPKVPEYFTVRQAYLIPPVPSRYMYSNISSTYMIVHNISLQGLNFIVENISQKIANGTIQPRLVCF